MEHYKDLINNKRYKNMVNKKSYNGEEAMIFLLLHYNMMIKEILHMIQDMLISMQKIYH